MNHTLWSKLFALLERLIMDRCNGKVKKEFAGYGFTYRWDD